MFRRSSSERARRLVYRSRPAPTSVGLQPSTSSPIVVQKAGSIAKKRELPLIRLESEDEEADERTRLMSREHEPGLLREPSAEEDDDEKLQSVHISVPEFPIATATFRRPRSSSIIGSRHGSIAAQGGRGRRFTLNPLIFAKVSPKSLFV
jgi:hypothetical protein